MDALRRSKEMNEIENEAALMRLREAGCTPEEIKRFCQLRQAYAIAQRRERWDQRRPLLVRLLEQVGRLLQEGTPSIPWW